MKVTKQEGKGKLSIASAAGDSEQVLTPRQALEAVIERYKVQNPAKYELKKEALEAQLEALSN